MTTPRTKTLKNKADKLFSQSVRARGVCQRCGRTPPAVVLHCSHVMSRKYTAIRWDERNALCMCQGCHFWQHQNPAENALFLLEVVGETELDALRKEALAYTGTISKVDYESLVKELEGRAA